MRLTTARLGGSVCRTSPNSMNVPSGSLAQVLAQLAALEATVTWCAVIPVAVDDDPAPGQHRVHSAGDLHTLVGRVVHVHVVDGGREHLPGFGVIDHDVGIRPRRDDALA